MNLAVLQLVARELNGILPGAFINKIHQPLPREIVLRMRVPGGGEKKLVLSADPQLGRIHLTGVKIPNPPRPPRFCAFLRAHFQGFVIAGIGSAQDDRTSIITGLRGPAENRIERLLILELLGRDSNIILVDGATNKILDCLHHIPEKESGNRAVLPGMPYLPPPKHSRRSQTLDQISSMAEISPGISRDPNGVGSPTVQAASGDEHFDSMNEAVDSFYSDRLNRILLEGFRRETAAPVKSKIDKLSRRLIKILADKERLKGFAALSLDGELLKANLNKAKKGMAGIEVTDWNTGANRLLRLDPALSPVENMERIFRRSAKGKRGEKAVNERLSQTVEEKQALEDVLFFISQARDVAELELQAGDLRNPQKTEKQGPKDRGSLIEDDSRLFRSLQAPSGKRVLVGKSGKGNEFLLRKKARKGDLWFHVKGIAGAHVILKQETGDLAGTEDLEFAAALAVEFSRAKNKGKTEVIIADVADLGHPKGAVPGQVTVKKYKTIMSEGVSANLD